MMELLDNLANCSSVHRDPTPKVKRKIQQLTMKALTHGDICEKESDHLNVTHPKMGIIYEIPKIHKTETDPPYHPIVTTIG